LRGISLGVLRTGQLPSPSSLVQPPLINCTHLPARYKPTTLNPKTNDTTSPNAQTQQQDLATLSRRLLAISGGDDQAYAVCGAAATKAVVITAALTTNPSGDAPAWKSSGANGTAEDTASWGCEAVKLSTNNLTATFNCSAVPTGVHVIEFTSESCVVGWTGVLACPAGFMTASAASTLQPRLPLTARDHPTFPPNIVSSNLTNPHDTNTQP